MSTKLKLQFPSNDTGENEGLSHAGIETFKGSPISSIARETAQNSRDAHSSFPVRLAFDMIDIDVATFPDFGEFDEALKACAARASLGSDLKEKQFFAKATKMLGEKSLPALRISDSGTTGLVGPCSDGTPFHSLVKASGVSQKSESTSGGSYGIGKNAAFAVSDLHTVFYSTIYEEDGVQHFLAQGKCTLVSHKRDGNNKRATGYWSTPGYMPVEQEADAPEWLSRDVVGTTTVSIGFSASPDWQFKISESLVRNFFAAVHAGELEFEVNDQTILINRETLPDIFVMKDVLDAAAAQRTIEDLDFSKQLFNCLIDDECKPFEFAIPGLGQFSLHLLIREGLPKRVAFIRNGMMITSNLQNFADKLLNFPMYKEFIAVVQPIDQAGKTIIKRLENPQHNELSADRLVEESEQKAVRACMDSLGRKIRKIIRDEAYITPTKETALDEMNEFFGDAGKSDQIPVPNDADTNPITVVFTPPKIKNEPQSDGASDDSEDDDSGGSEGNQQRDGGDEPGTGEGKGDGFGGHGGGETFTFENFRNIQDVGDPDHRRILIFTPNKTGNVSVSVHVKGMQRDSPLHGVTLINSNGEEVGTVSTVAGTPVNLTACFKTPYRGPIGLRLRAISEVPHEAS